MSGPQFMPLYVGDYLKDTQHLTAEQHGAYLLLLFACWSMAKIPNDDEKLMAITRCESMAKWRNIRKTLEPFFKISQGFWHQKRIKKELKKSTQTHNHRSAAGQKGAATRWQHKVKTKNGPAYGPAYGKTMAGPSPLPPSPQTPLPSSPPQPQPEALPPLTPPSRGRGGGARGGFVKKSPRTIQAEAFYLAALAPSRNR
jgi:uncharacterized protein YdaU (DUF1376 family)